MSDLILFNIIFGAASIYLIIKGYQRGFQNFQDLDWSESVALEMLKKQGEKEYEQKKDRILNPEKRRRGGLQQFYVGIVFLILVLLMDIATIMRWN